MLSSVRYWGTIFCWGATVCVYGQVQIPRASYPIRELPPISCQYAPNSQETLKQNREPSPNQQVLPNATSKPVELIPIPAIAESITVLPTIEIREPSRLNPKSTSFLAQNPALANSPFVQEVLPKPQSVLASESPLCIKEQRVFPINLVTALQLAQARPIDVQVAAQQIELAAAQYERARVLWYPNIVVGSDYLHHDGSFQNFAGTVLKESRTSAMFGVGVNVVFGLSDAIFAPLAARQDWNARQATAQAVGNDTALTVAEVYIAVLFAKGDYIAAKELLLQAEEVAQKTKQLAEGLAPPVEATRARVELARRKQLAISALERWRVASAELVRVLRLESTVLLDPIESPAMPILLISPSNTVDELIATALTNRPELAANQAIVQATLQLLKQEKLRPLVPSILLRSTSTNPSGSLAYGAFGGGEGGRLRDFKARFDYDVQILWEFQNLGFGNKARVAERQVELATATLETFRIQDRIAAEVTTAFAQSNAAADRLREAEPALQDAIDSVKKNLEGMSQTRRIGNILVLVNRPLEVVAAVQALGQANVDYLTAVADYNRSQFRLFRALGNPPQSILSKQP